ncbi:MAG: MFS transporter [Betaproteobacteria bacterium]|nr:MAG: MFS transporter [Betaproteobacteria bacterium]
MRLRPDPVVTPDDLERGKRALVKDAAWASLVGALYGGVILVGFALELGATPFIIGLLAAIPFVAQLAQLPAIALVERLRQRRKISVIAVTVSRTLILGLALVPFIGDPSMQLAALIMAQLAITLLGSVGGCSLNSWLHQLLERQPIGELFSRRLFWSTVLASLGALIAGQLVQHWPFAHKLHAYSVAFALAGAAGFVSTSYLARVPEPVMGGSAPPLPVAAMIRSPFRDPNFRRVIIFMGAWNLASNLAAPFITVYLLKQLGYPMGTVTTLWIASQVANALTMYLWGRLSDRLSNKAILAVALPAYFGCLVALPFAAIPEVHALTLPLLYVIHIVMGAAAGGIGLATGNLGLKLAPQGQGTAYLANVTLIGSLAGGVAALLGGSLAGWFESRELAFFFHWTSPGRAQALTVLQFRHWEFLFAISFLLGSYVLHALSRIREGQEISERVVIQQFAAEAARSLDQLSPIDGLRAVILFPFGRLSERRRRPRA